MQITTVNHGFQLRLRCREDWVQAEPHDDGRTGYCFNLSRSHAAVFPTQQEAAQFAKAIPADLMVVPA